MAHFVTVSDGLVTREALTNSSEVLPQLTVSDDPWILEDGNPHAVVGDHFNGTNFTLDHTALTVAQGAKIAELRDACATHIKNGFPVGLILEGDGDPRDYCFPSMVKDQANLHVLALTAQDQGSYPFWCGPGTRVTDATDWLQRFLTKTQVLWAATGLSVHIIDAQWELNTKVNGYAPESIVGLLAMTTVTEVNAVVFEPPSS